MMEQLKARQHTADHIFSTLLESKYNAKSKAMQFGPDFVRMVWECKTDLREKKDEFEKCTNEEIGRGREVKCYALPYAEAAKIADLSLIPKSVSKPTIYEIAGLNKIACAGPHVSNTKEVGAFKILEIKRKGKDIYEIKYQVYDMKSDVSNQSEGRASTEMDQPKGVRDFLPKEKFVRDYIADAFRKTAEKYGFVPLETPALELESVATAKGGNAPGTDAYEELYKVTDRAGRKLVLKFEQTFPLARVVATNSQIPKPFKRYQIDRAWRDGPTKVGRYKEFWQMDVDTVGVKSMLADAEILAFGAEFLRALGLKVVIKYSNRKLINGVLKYSGLSKDKWMAAMVSIDKLEKLGRDEVLDEARQQGVDEDCLVKALDILEQGEGIAALNQMAKYLDNEEAQQGIAELKEMAKFLKALGVKEAVFVPSLCRGLSYYTGPIFEAFLKSGKFKSSLFGGGRYDDMIGQFIGSKELVPATGFGAGLDTIYDALMLEGKAKPIETTTKVFIVPIQATEAALGVASELRAAGINTDIDIIGRSLSKNLSFCNSQNIPFAVFVGKKELELGKVKLRDMVSGKEQLLTASQLVKKLG